MRAHRIVSNPFWALVVVAATLFCITVLALLMLGHGDAAAPVNRILSRYGSPLVICEVVVILLAALAALAFDRRQTLRTRSDHQTPPSED
jgi:multisubunit Na+/H+ antiporter MnhB subunit